jgi:hypothetical protein
LFPWGVNGGGTGDERDPKVDRPTLLTHQARVVADVEEFLQDLPIGKVYARRATAQRSGIPGVLKIGIEVAWIRELFHPSAPHVR